ncbi:hypothetical protein PUN28_010810 [Cardiocondyla obscurior]|uniref:Secreted protein n=1 Tax=Cardiocondyla obscurior TaxID=286306 RepID=A0AAW2FL76_9HYME
MSVQLPFCGLYSFLQVVGFALGGICPLTRFSACSARCRSFCCVCCKVCTCACSRCTSRIWASSASLATRSGVCADLLLLLLLHTTQFLAQRIAFILQLLHICGKTLEILLAGLSHFLILGGL